MDEPVLDPKWTQSSAGRGRRGAEISDSFKLILIQAVM